MARACAQITSCHLAKVKCGEGHLGRPSSAANPEQSHSWKAGADFHWWFWQCRTSVIQWSTTPPLCPVRGPANKNVPAYTPLSIPIRLPFPGEGALSLYPVIPWVLREGRVVGLATSLLGESKAAEMCTTHGRNYVAHLTSEISPPSSFSFSLNLSLPLLFSQITPRLVKLIDWFLVQVGLFRWAGHWLGVLLSNHNYDFSVASDINQEACKCIKKKKSLQCRKDIIRPVLIKR